MSLLLGVGSIGVGMLPLSFVFSKSHLARLSAVGTGILLGAALGVIIPEGIETLVTSNTSTEFPTSKIALSLLIGFTFMLIVEQSTSSHSHSTSIPLHSVKRTASDVEFDLDLDELEREQGVGSSESGVGTMSPEDSEAEAKKRAFPLTTGLVIHGVADGLALGVSALSDSGPESSADLSLIVFFALLIHKAPTVLALTSALLSTSLPRSTCRKHIAIFSLSTPLSALISYELLNLLGALNGSFTGIALLISGGTFLYVATVLQPVSHHSQASSSEELNGRVRSVLIVAGMFVPILIEAVLGHDHEAPS